MPWTRATSRPRLIDGQLNRIVLDPLLHEQYPADVLTDVAGLGLLDHVADRDLTIISTTIDALGVNYYDGQAVSARPAPAPRGAEPVTRPSPFPAASGAHACSRGLPVTGMG